MSLYRVHFTWNDRDLTLRASTLDLTHPYFVSITGIIFPEGESLIIDPSEDEVRRTFGNADHLMIPFQAVKLIEEIKEPNRKKKPVVREFKVIDHEEQDTRPDE
ncbi:MAG: DUF1820 family protein [Spirochaetales bacterium]